MDSQPTTNHREIEEVAAAWLAKRDGAGLSADEEAEYTRWLSASTAHRVAMLRLQAAWRQADRLKALGAGIAPGSIPGAGQWGLVASAEDHSGDAAITAVAAGGGSDAGASAVSEIEAPVPISATTRSRTRTFMHLGWATGFALVVVLALGWYLRPQGSTYRTELGSVATVPLSDGSKITLNTDSEIRLAVSDTERRIELERGEAFFEVAKDPKRPFVVMAGDQRVVAVGTKFSVQRAEARDDEIRVVVTEGRVRVGPAAGKGAALPPAEVAAGSVARSDGEGVLLDAAPARPVDEYLSWREGYLVFRGTTLEDAVAEFNRYNATKLVIEDRSIAAIQIGGNFRSTNVDAFARLLEGGFPVHVERRGDEIVLTAN